MTWRQSDRKVTEPPAHQPTVLILKYSFQKHACFSTHTLWFHLSVLNNNLIDTYQVTFNCRIIKQYHGESLRREKRRISGGKWKMLDHQIYVLKFSENCKGVSQTSPKHVVEIFSFHDKKSPTFIIAVA